MPLDRGTPEGSHSRLDGLRPPSPKTRLGSNSAFADWTTPDLSPPVPLCVSVLCVSCFVPPRVDPHAGSRTGQVAPRVWVAPSASPRPIDDSPRRGPGVLAIPQDAPAVDP